ncbi:hypothetical protein EVAR_82069_1 [Eumeta japonica]|uniref:Uncharacterized protein n=1 Tax=Eumeta variegata TaxID=151549 RepID=A0A4C1U2Y4_EUMVA|nr:hypothetical protein EVAR_82069_1 [Eumeta japonica]
MKTVGGTNFFNPFHASRRASSCVPTSYDYASACSHKRGFKGGLALYAVTTISVSWSSPVIRPNTPVLLYFFDNLASTLSVTGRQE